MLEIKKQKNITGQRRIWKFSSSSGFYCHVLLHTHTHTNKRQTKTNKRFIFYDSEKTRRKCETFYFPNGIQMVTIKKKKKGKHRYRKRWRHSKSLTFFVNARVTSDCFVFVLFFQKQIVNEVRNSAAIRRKPKEKDSMVYDCFEIQHVWKKIYRKENDGGWSNWGLVPSASRDPLRCDGMDTKNLCKYIRIFLIFHFAAFDRNAQTLYSARDCTANSRGRPIAGQLHEKPVDVIYTRT